MTDDKPVAKAKTKAAPRAGGSTIVPNNNPALSVTVPGSAPTFLPILAWRVGDGEPVPITPAGDRPLDAQHVLHDNDQRKCLIDGRWVKPA